LSARLSDSNLCERATVGALAGGIAGGVTNGVLVRAVPPCGCCQLHASLVTPV
jgi:hypothetical protein